LSVCHTIHSKKRNKASCGRIL